MTTHYRRRDFEPTHLLPTTFITQLTVGASVRTHRTTCLLPIQLTGWHGHASNGTVEYVTADGPLWESNWTKKSTLLPLPYVTH